MRRLGWIFGRKREAKVDEVRPPRPRPKIRKSVVDLICASAQSQHPHEFGGMLRVEKGVITEVLILPGTVSGETHAIFQFGMLPIDFSVKGTVHSHPGGNPRPSGADLELFRKYGNCHVIIAEPYTPRTWRGYDGRGEPLQFEVVDD